MNRIRLNQFKRWADEVDAELEHESEPSEWNDDVEIHTFRAVLERREPSLNHFGEIVQQPKSYVEVNGHVDKLEVMAGESLEITVEEWDDPGEENYEKREVQRTGQLGGEVQVSVWGDEFVFQEAGRDGHMRKITITPK